MNRIDDVIMTCTKVVENIVLSKKRITVALVGGETSDNNFHFFKIGRI